MKTLSLLILSIFIVQCSHSPTPVQKVESTPKEGVVFRCEPQKLSQIQNDLLKYFERLEVNPSQYKIKLDGGHLTYILSTPADDTNTLDLFKRPEYQIKDEVILLPTNNKNKPRRVSTVSQKEILLALLQHGRLTLFEKEHCSAEALIDHIGVRQNIVAWTEKLEWGWPDGGPAAWNPKYWKKGTPITKDPPHVIINDIFMNQKKYSIGCYTATKIVVIQGVLDYYHRIKKDPELVKKIEARLLADGEPLVDVEPGCMWKFESDYDKKRLTDPGKLLEIHYGIAPRNVVPGDWTYLWNTDLKTQDKTGYEGSNAVYLGRNKLDDYYNDHKGSYTFEEKLNEVWQWRNGVFSRTRHATKVRFLTNEALQALYNTPENGGLLFDFRTVPKLFHIQTQL